MTQTSANPQLSSLPFATINRKEIQVTDLDIPLIVKQAWNEIIAHNNPPILYRRGGELVRLEEKDNGDLKIVSVEQNRMRGVLARVCLFTMIFNGHSRIVDPPFSVIRDMLVNIDSRIPIIDRIVRCPIFAYDDSIIDTPGYHDNARVYYDVPVGLMIPTVADIPTEDDLEEARALIDDMLIDFPFEGESDRAHAYALLLQMFCRDKIIGSTPMYGSESPVVGTGKGKLVDALLIPSLGTKHHVISQPGDDDEWRKQLTASLREGPPVIKIDNVTKPVDSGVFANILTTDDFDTRVLGTSVNVSLPVRCAWVMTANNPVLSMEIARRYVRMRLVPDVDRPWLRDQFKHKDLLGWVIANRGQLIWAALTLIRYGIQNNPHNLHRIGSFEHWADVMGNILDAIGVPGFLGNVNDIYEQSDVETAMWTNLVDIWWNTHGSADVIASEVYKIVVDNEIAIQLNGKNENALKASMGKKIATMRDRIFSIGDKANPIQVRVTKSDATKSRAIMWRLDPSVMPTGTGAPTSTPAPVTPATGNGHAQTPLSATNGAASLDNDDEYQSNLNRERNAIEAASIANYSLSHELLTYITDPVIRSRAEAEVEAIEVRDEMGI